MSISRPGLTNRLASRAEWVDETVVTTPLILSNRSGQKISAFLDQPSEIGPHIAPIILVPGYGKTKSSHLRVAYYLALNGLRVIRYDHSHHVGESDGSMLFTTLSQMEEDLAAVIDFAETESATNPVGLVAESLGARIALKRASNDKRVRYFVSLIGVFDVQGTLRTIYNEDGFVERTRGSALGIRDIMGFQVDADRFIDDAMKHNFQSLETAIEDANKLSIPTLFFVAEKDPWVSPDAVRAVFGRCPPGSRKLQLLPGILHELYENPLIAADVCCEIVRAAKQSFPEKPGHGTLIRIPSEKSIVARSRLEKRGSSKDLKTAEEKIFWAEYLEKYAYIVKLQDYWNLLDSIGDSLGTLKKGEKILDAGCGIGNFGTFLLVRNLYQTLQLRTTSLRRRAWARYIGVDFVEAAVRQAKVMHREIHREFAPKVEWMSNEAALMDCDYSVTDLDSALPFKNHYFDKIVSNFVLSYVKDPTFTLREMCRTLKNGGRIVISSLKPNADLSLIYRNYIAVSRTVEEREQARMVLSNAGLIKYKEAQGFYQFFSESQMEEFLLDAGCQVVQVYRAFGDQANVAVGQKSTR